MRGIHAIGHCTNCTSTDVRDEGASYARQTSQERTRRFGLRLASLCVAVMLLASGCAAIPMGESGPLADTKEESLVGEAWKWLCIAADEGHPQAHVNAMKALARLHRPWGDDEYVLEENNGVAYPWYRLSAAFDPRWAVAEEMTAHEITEAEQMARDWKPGQCPAS